MLVIERHFYLSFILYYYKMTVKLPKIMLLSQSRTNTSGIGYRSKVKRKLLRLRRHEKCIQMFIGLNYIIKIDDAYDNNLLKRKNSMYVRKYAKRCEQNIIRKLTMTYCKRLIVQRTKKKNRILHFLFVQFICCDRCHYRQTTLFAKNNNVFVTTPTVHNCLY